MWNCSGYVPGRWEVRRNWVGRVLKSLGVGRLEKQTLLVEPEGDDRHLPLAFGWKIVFLRLQVFPLLPPQCPPPPAPVWQLP